MQTIAALKEEEQRLASLEDASTRAREESWAAGSKVSEAQDALRQAQHAEPQRLVYAYANAANGGNGAEISPVDAAQLVLDQALQEDHRILQLENMLSDELRTVSRRRDRAQYAVHQALADLVCNSTEFAHLFDELRFAWSRLRGIRKAFWTITRALDGQMPNELLERWQATISLNVEAIRDSVGPIPTDEAPAEAWREALEALLTDPDAELPQDV